MIAFALMLLMMFGMAESEFRDEDLVFTQIINAQKIKPPKYAGN